MNLILNQQKKISIGSWVRVSCNQPFTGQVNARLDIEDLFTKQISYRYVVVAEDGERYSCEIGKDGCTHIAQVLKPKKKSAK